MLSRCTAFHCACLLTVALITACSRAQAGPPPTVPVHLERNQSTTFGNSVYILGNVPALGGGDVRQAVKLSPLNYPVWSIDLDLPATRTIRYRYLLRDDGPDQVGNISNATYLTTTITLQTSGTALLRHGTFLYRKATSQPPVLEVNEPGGLRRITFFPNGAGRTAGETLWKANIPNLPYGEWEFRIDLGGGTYDKPGGQAFYRTGLGSPLMQDGNLFNYIPPASVAQQQILRVSFSGRLSTRNLYIYLPRGYATPGNTKRYPVLYMHDGQNDFIAYRDGPFGTWAADVTAGNLIAHGRMRECIIVGIAHGGSERISEYLPPYSTNPLDGDEPGRADVTAAYYMEDVKTYIDATYRTLTDRDNTATCGSSMGGVMSTYLAWEFPSFARHHAALSPAYWITPELVDKLDSESPRDMRLWLDSGTEGEDPDPDGYFETYATRDRLLSNGYRIGPNFQHYVAIGAHHTESAWAGRLDKVFTFLFPVSQEPELPTDNAVGGHWALFE